MSWALTVRPDGTVEADGAALKHGFTLSAMFDGKLYVREPLVRELGLPPHAADLTIVLAALERWGLAAASRFNGSFSLVAWRRDEPQVYGVRDALGTRPFFYAQRAGVIILSDELDYVADHKLVRARPDSIAVAALFANRLSPQHETFLVGVSRLPQGHALEWRPDGARTWRYWDPAPPSEPLTWATPDEVAEFDALMQEAVCRRLARKTGIFLSGGLDSVTVAAYAADCSATHGEAPLALSLVFPGEGDESAVQMSVARSLRLPHVIERIDDVVGSRGVFGAAIELAAGWPAPLLNLWLPAYIALAQHAQKRGVSAILTGGGGDEWLTASPFYIADLMRTGRFRALVRFVAAHYRSYSEPTPALLYRDLWQFGVRALLVDALRPLIEGRAKRLMHARLDRILPRWLAPDRNLRAAIYARPTISLSPRSHGTLYGREIRTAITHGLIDHEMEEFFEAGKRCGAEIVQPFWDQDLLELLFRTRPEMLSKGGRSKGLVRDTLEARFPNRGFGEQRKLSATPYFGRLLLTEGAAERARFGRLEALGDLGVVDAVAADREFDRVILEQDRAQAWWIWFILSFEAWARRRA